LAFGRAADADADHVAVQLARAEVAAAVAAAAAAGDGGPGRQPFGTGRRGRGAEAGEADPPCAPPGGSARCGSGLKLDSAPARASDG